MDDKVAMSFRLEVFWWLFTGLLAFGVTYPILQKVNDYPFLFINLFFIVVFVTLTRYIFLLKHTFLADRQILKALLIVFSIPLTAYLVGELYYFQTYLDEKGFEGFLSIIPFEERESFGSFIRNEMMLFGVGSIISAVMLPFRMVLSIWRWKNRGTT